MAACRPPLLGFMSFNRTSKKMDELKISWTLGEDCVLTSFCIIHSREVVKCCLGLRIVHRSWADAWVHYRLEASLHALLPIVWKTGRTPTRQWMNHSPCLSAFPLFIIIWLDPFMSPTKWYFLSNLLYNLIATRFSWVSAVNNTFLVHGHLYWQNLQCMTK